MSNSKYFIIVFLFASLQGVSQQRPFWSSFYENAFIWNPAMTGRSSDGDLSITSRKQWSGFENSPEYGSLGLQYPVVRRQSKVSIGGFIDYDKVGPYTQSSFAGTFAYKIRPQLFGKRKDMLSFGLNVNINQLKYSVDGLTAFDGLSQDPGLVGTNSSIVPNVGVGLFYMSVSDDRMDRNHYYFGLSANQLIPSHLQFSDQNQLSLVTHYTANFGFRYLPRRSDYFVEPGLFVAYTQSKALRIMANVKYEFINRFWLSFGMVSNADVFGQVGFIFDEDSILGGLVNNGSIRLGSKVNYSYGEIGSYSGIGYELYLAYVFSNESY